VNGNTRSPVMVHKYTLVNNANLDQQFVVVRPAEPAVMEGDVVLVPAVDEVVVKQFEYCSKRQLRAIRKGRLLKTKHHVGMLFAQREDGTHYPVSLKKRELGTFKPFSDSAKAWLAAAKAGVPIEEQKKAMEMHRTYKEA
jgi:hypothetical protein